MLENGSYTAYKVPLTCAYKVLGSKIGGIIVPPCISKSVLLSAKLIFNKPIFCYFSVEPYEQALLVNSLNFMYRRSQRNFLEITTEANKIGFFKIIISKNLQ